MVIRLLALFLIYMREICLSSELIPMDTTHLTFLGTYLTSISSILNTSIFAIFVASLQILLKAALSTSTANIIIISLFRIRSGPHVIT